MVLEQRRHLKTHSYPLLQICREVWYNYFQPGTFRAFLACLYQAVLTGQAPQWPWLLDESFAVENETFLPSAKGNEWYVSKSDLQTFKDACECDLTPVGGQDWEELLSKDWDGGKYTAWRRMLPTGRTEYKSITISENASAEEFMDFYLDDDTRPKWDNMITEHELLENRMEAPSERMQVVRWVRSFPFAFLSQREYVIARRVFPGEDGAIYGITKGIEHPNAPKRSGIVRMDTYYSMWRNKTITRPDGSFACETLLLHFEDFKIPENLARFTVRHGMGGFVKKLAGGVTQFVSERRSRVAPTCADPEAYGTLAVIAAPEVMPRVGSVASEFASDSAYTSGDGSAGTSGTKRSSSPSMRRIGYMMVAGSVAIALSRVNSSSASGRVKKHKKTAGHRPHHPHHAHHHGHKYHLLHSNSHSSSLRSHKLDIDATAAAAAATAHRDETVA